MSVAPVTPPAHPCDWAGRHLLGLEDLSRTTWKPFSTRHGLFPSIHEYARLFSVDRGRRRRAKSDILLLAPGPINRGVEVADGPHSAILQQEANGLAVRRAVLSLLCGRAEGEG